MSAEDMHEAPRCQHVRLSGRQCKAPAKRGNNYCLFHEAEHDNSIDLTFPPVEDAASVAVATAQIIEAIKGDMIDYRRASLLFAGLRIARANLKQLGMEMGEELTPTLAKPARVGHPEEDDDIPGPSLAEILLERLNALEAETAAEEGVAAPEPINIKEALASGKDMGHVLLDCLQSLEEPESGVPPGPPPVEGDQPTA
jgi:hypothetical protein